MTVVIVHVVVATNIYIYIYTSFHQYYDSRAKRVWDPYSGYVLWSRIKLLLKDLYKPWLQLLTQDCIGDHMSHSFDHGSVSVLLFSCKGNAMSVSVVVARKLHTCVYVYTHMHVCISVYTYICIIPAPF